MPQVNEMPWMLVSLQSFMIFICSLLLFNSFNFLSKSSLMHFNFVGLSVILH